ncbi:MAG TPA: SpvB/TcaC N-terminal domain-containing protein [Chitinophagaceae bacterium]
MKNNTRYIYSALLLLLFLGLGSYLAANNLLHLFKASEETTTVDAESETGSHVAKKEKLDKRRFNFEEGITEQKLVSNEGGTLAIRGAKLEIPSDALNTAVNISITALTEAELPPLSQGMVNVTTNGGGFRFLPHGTHFEKKVTVTLPFDAMLIPVGYGVRDIKTYFFNETTAQWETLEKINEDKENGQINSLTNHFTDMINGVIKVPEMASTLGFSPTIIKDIKAANPSEEVSMIEVPTANNKGNLSLNFPIKLPAGRKGMQPELNIQYGSDANNGWLGMGWNLSLPSITIETRWGVPRFKGDVETETYTLNGEQLGPVAHRGLAVSRSSEKRFHLRVEGKFQKIIRHGSQPSNYWWEVSDKDGKRQFYGGRPGQGVEPGGVLTDGAGNIGHWALVETRDLNGNFIKYHYKKVTDVGIPGGTVQGYQLYIDKITYAGHNGEEGKYSVVFTTDRDLGETKRKDVIINARLGFKQVTADKLRKVEVQYNGANIRSYELQYTEGAFFKTLLQNIIEFDAAGLEFSRHQLGYYDDIRQAGIYHPFAAQQTWEAQNDAVGASFLNPTTFIGDHASSLGASKSSGFGAGLTVTAGPFDFLLFTKTNTAGASFGYANSNSEGMLALIDINGDGLADKVFKDGGQLFYRRNESGPGGQLRFGSRRPISGLSDFDKSKSRTLEAGIESNFVIYAGVQYSNTKNERSTYFADANGDQLVDIVNQGTVFFNHRGADGNPFFNSSSTGTPSPIQSISTVDDALVQIDSAELAQLEKDNPLHDVVKLWKAPYDGIISISNSVQLIEDTSPERLGYTAADGVRVAIQHNGSELWSEFIGEDDYSPKTPAGVGSIAVIRGDQLYFRVQSVYDGAYDQVSWNPRITYTAHVPGLDDANGFAVYDFTASSDFLATAPMSLGMPINGEIRISGLLQKPVTSDDIHLEIVRKTTTSETVIWQNNLAWDSTLSDSINFTQVVDKGDDLFFRVGSSSNIKWSDLSWMPRVYYIASNDTAVTEVTNSQGQPTIDFFPVVDYRLYNRNINPSLVWVAPATASFSFTPVLSLNAGVNESGDIGFSLKKKNSLLAKETIHVSPGGQSGNATINLDLNQGDSLFAEYHTRSEALWNFVNSAQVEIAGGATQTIVAGAHVYSAETHRFGAMYRNWGQFAYNGNGNFGNIPIIEDSLVIDSSLSNPDSIDLSNAANEQDMQDAFSNGNGNTPSDDRFVYMVPMANNNTWNGYDNLTYVTPAIISASRMGDDNLLPINPLQGPGAGSGSGASAIKKVSQTHNVSVAAGFGLGASYSHGSTTQLYEYTDINGDRYPDILSKNKIQYTLPFGGLDAQAVSFVYGDVEHSSHNTFGITKGGTFLKSSSFNFRKDNRGAKAAGAEASAKVSASITGSFNFNDDNTSIGWVDINGDGLPDRVHRDGRVELNLGYKLAPPENWGYLGIGEGNSISYGGGLGINISNYSIAAGIGLQRSENNLNKVLRDVNGDGLPDYVTDRALDVIFDSHPIEVSLNTGNGFAAPVEWTGAHCINEDISTGESANVAFTACIPLVPPIPVAKVCFNPSASISHGVSRERVEIMDIDGDECPDFLESEKDNDLKIKLSSIRRTNLLKQVSRPMGSEFLVNYKRMGNSDDMPNSVWTLASVEVSDGVGGDGADQMLTSFEYEEGYFDRHEREFFGFKRIKTNEHDTRDSNSIYRTRVQLFANANFYEKGLILAEHLQDSSGKKFNETLYSYELKNVQTGADLPPGSEFSDREEAFPALTETRMLIYEGQPVAAKTTRTQYSYDPAGNILSQTDFGGAGDMDDRTTDITYHAVQDLYLLNIPKSVLVSNGTQIFRKREQDIIATSGDITEIRSFSAPGLASIHNMEYDIYGNVVKMTRPKNADGQRLSYLYEYDPDVNKFITRIEDSYGSVSTWVYDPRFGKPLTVTDQNNQQTIYTLDNLGRIATIAGPKELAAGVPFTIAFEYHPGATVPWAMTRHYDEDNPGNFIETVTFMDGLMRPLQIKKDGALFTSPGAPDVEVMLVSGAATYDAFGRNVELFYPVTEAKGNEGVYNNTRDSVAPTATAYDILDREVKKVRPDGTTLLTGYGFGNDRAGIIQCRKLVTDGNGIREETFTDVRSRMTSIRRIFSQGNDIWTSYEYNAIDELRKTVNDKGDSTVSEFDWLGRKVALRHPDAGKTSFEYDAAGQLIKKKTANLQNTTRSIRYIYDRERLVKIIYPYNQENNVKYHYGAANSPYNRTGRIKVQEDATGSQEFFYDALGNIVKTVRTIVLPHHGWRTYKTRWSYDSWNRIQEIVYPDGEELSYAYNKGGMLATMQGRQDNRTYQYIRQTGYDKFEKRVYLKYGNGTETFVAYETDRRRLSKVKAETSTNREMMDILYTYDNENNITKLINDADPPNHRQMGGKSEYNFVYDDLYRLTNATGYFSGRKKHRFNFSMLYGSNGNILKKEQLHETRGSNSYHWHTEDETSYSEIYKYDAQQPHAPDKIGQRQYRHDANGNQIAWFTHSHHHHGHSRIIRWDEENRISSITDNGALVSYTYDADGERILKSSGGGHHRVNVNGEPAARGNGRGNYTIYVNQWFVVEGKKVTKHFFADSLRILIREGDDDDDDHHHDKASQEVAGQTADVKVDYAQKENDAKSMLSRLYLESDIEDPEKEDLDDSKLLPTASKSTPANTNEQGKGGNNNHYREPDQYYFHLDHLKNTSFITDGKGEVIQHIEYFPFGEIFVEERNDDATNYLFNSKETDEETGLHYYGARYYDSRTSVWQSADPRKEEFPGWSPYCFSLQNPINYNDPDGRAPVTAVNRKDAGSFVKVAVDYFEDRSGTATTYSFAHLTNRVFWSGGPEAMTAAKTFAEKNNSITLEMTFEGQNLEAITAKLGDNGVGFSITENFWKKISSGYAHGATGEVNVFRKEKLREGNIWEGQEQKILDAKGKKYTQHLVPEAVKAPTPPKVKEDNNP